MKDDEPAGVLDELARRLSVKKLLADFPSLTTDRLKEILEQASRAMGRAPSRPNGKKGSAHKWIINVDGASRGNPGPAGAGALLQYGDNRIEPKKFLGRVTNNVAEYEALIIALEGTLGRGAERIEVRSDSELMVKQMNGEYRVKSAKLAPLFQKARSLASQFREVKIIHIGRDENAEADRLANLAIDAGRDH